MRSRRFAALVMGAFLTGALLATPISQAATFAYDDWVLPSGTGNTIYPKNFTTTTDEVNTWIRVTQWSQTPRTIAVHNIDCSTGAARGSWIDYASSEFGYKTVWAGATGCVKYEAGAYGLSSLTISGNFKY
jgi:hypothetical protein